MLLNSIITLLHIIIIMPLNSIIMPHNIIIMLLNMKFMPLNSIIRPGNIIIMLVRPPAGLFYRKRPPQHTRHIERGSRGERDIVPSTQEGGHAYVA